MQNVTSIPQPCSHINAPFPTSFKGTVPLCSLLLAPCLLFRCLRERFPLSSHLFYYSQPPPREPGPRSTPRNLHLSTPVGPPYITRPPPSLERLPSKSTSPVPLFPGVFTTPFVNFTNEVNFNLPIYQQDVIPRLQNIESRIAAMDSANISISVLMFGPDGIQGVFNSTFATYAASFSTTTWRGSISMGITVGDSSSGTIMLFKTLSRLL